MCVCVCVCVCVHVQTQNTCNSSQSPDNEKDVQNNVKTIFFFKAKTFLLCYHKNVLTTFKCYQ